MILRKVTVVESRSFEPVQEGIRHSRPPWVSQLWVKKLVSTWHHWVDVVPLWRLWPDRWKGSTMNSTAVSVKLYFALESPWNDSQHPDHTETGCGVIIGTPTTFTVMGEVKVKVNCLLLWNYYFWWKIHMVLLHPIKRCLFLTFPVFWSIISPHISMELALKNWRSPG